MGGANFVTGSGQVLLRKKTANPLTFFIGDPFAYLFRESLLPLQVLSFAWGFTKNFIQKKAKGYNGQCKKAQSPECSELLNE